MATEVGTAYVTLMPSMDRFNSEVRKALKGGNAFSVRQMLGEILIVETSGASSIMPRMTPYPSAPTVTTAAINARKTSRIRTAPIRLSFLRVLAISSSSIFSRPRYV